MLWKLIFTVFILFSLNCLGADVGIERQYKLDTVYSGTFDLVDEYGKTLYKVPLPEGNWILFHKLDDKSGSSNGNPRKMAEIGLANLIANKVSSLIYIRYVVDNIYSWKWSDEPCKSVTNFFYMNDFNKKLWEQECLITRISAKNQTSKFNNSLDKFWSVRNLDHYSSNFIIMDYHRHGEQGKFLKFQYVVDPTAYGYVGSNLSQGEISQSNWHPLNYKKFTANAKFIQYFNTFAIEYAKELAKAYENKSQEFTRLAFNPEVNLPVSQYSAAQSASSLQSTNQQSSKVDLPTQSQQKFSSGSRKALVIGNDSYQNTTKLQNAREDAKSISTSLANLGYQVTLKLDLKERDMKAALRNFAMQIEGGDEVVFYFSGHGIQINNSNFLVPVDIAGENEAQIKDEAIPLQRILDDISDRKARFALAIIDACRDNPFKVAGRSIGGRGLSPTTAATGQMIVFAAGAGQQALDRLGNNDKDRNGLFTRVLLKEIEKPNQSIDRIIKNVRLEVSQLAKSVGHDQVPAIYDQVLGDFYFKVQR